MKLEDVREELRKHADESRKKRAEITNPTAKNRHGVRLPIVAALAKKLYNADPEHALRLCEEAINSDYSEEQMFCAKTLLFACKKNPERVFNMTMNMLNRIHTWGICDTLATQSIAHYSIKNQEKVLDLAFEGVENENFWIRRFWIAALAPLGLKKNKDEADVSKILSILDKVMLDKEKYVQKAIHWVLREVSWRDQQAVFNFIKKWLGKAPRSTLWQGSEKLSPELRNQLT